MYFHAMNLKQLLLAIIILGYGSNVNAQTDSISSDSLSLVSDKNLDTLVTKKNMVKINLLALTLKTVTLQYERVINKFLSVAISGRYMPSMSMPYKNFIYTRLGSDDPEVKETIDNMLISNFAITPEVRFYLGKKGYGKGFYLAPSYRYAYFTLDNLVYTYVDDEDLEGNINLSGNMTANYGGVTIGVQWPLGKHLSLDWWIFSPFIGYEKTKLSGLTSEALSEDTQDILRQDLEDIEIPYTTATVDVHEYGVSVQLRGYMVGISTGLAFGVRF